MKIWKIAGSVMPPPLLVNTIVEEIKNFNASSEKVRHKIIPVDLTGWRYGGNEILDRAEETEYKKVKEIAESWSKIPKKDLSFLSEDHRNSMEEVMADPRAKAKSNIRFIFISLTKMQNDFVHRGSPANYMTKLNILNCLTKDGFYPFDISTLKKFIEHELIHYSQNILLLATSKKYFQPPKSVRDNNSLYDPHQSYKEWVLQDIEYQSILHDLIDDFRASLEYRTDKKEKKEEFFRRFTNQDERLSNLKAFNIGKYNAMVSQLYKSFF